MLADEIGRRRLTQHDAETLEEEVLKRRKWDDYTPGGAGWMTTGADPLCHAKVNTIYIVFDMQFLN